MASSKSKQTHRCVMNGCARITAQCEGAHECFQFSFHQKCHQILPPALRERERERERERKLETHAKIQIQYPQHPMIASYCKKNSELLSDLMYKCLYWST